MTTLVASMLVALVVVVVFRTYAPVIDLTGTWHGSESWGTKFTITRFADGSFSQELDTSRSDVPHTPPVIRAKGRWSLHGSTYSMVYDEISEEGPLSQRPWSVDIKVQSPTTFRYFADEGNGVIEEKQ